MVPALNMAVFLLHTYTNGEISSCQFTQTVASELKDSKGFKGGTTIRGCAVFCSLSDVCLTFVHHKYTSICIVYGNYIEQAEPLQGRGLTVYQKVRDSKVAVYSGQGYTTITATTTTTTTVDPVVFMQGGKQYKRICDHSGRYVSGQCLSISNTRSNWNEAKSVCGRRKGYLTEVLDELFQSFLMEISQRSKTGCIWLGGRKSRHENQSSWSWMRSGKTIKYSNWAPGHADQRGGGCLATSYLWNFQWKILKCVMQCRFMCTAKWKKKKVLHYDMVDCGKHGGKGFHNSCYTYFTDKVAWNEAKKRCKRLNMYIAEVSTEQQHAFVDYYLKYWKKLNHARFFNSWIGLTDRKREKTWIWEQSGNRVKFTNWLKGFATSPNCCQVTLMDDGHVMKTVLKSVEKEISDGTTDDVAIKWNTFVKAGGSNSGYIWKRKTIQSWKRSLAVPQRTVAFVDDA